MKKGFGLVGVLIIVGIIAIGSGGYYYSHNKNSISKDDFEIIFDDNEDIIGQEVEQHEENDLEIAVENKVASWKTYKNEEYGFEFEYPKNWEITSEKDGQYCSSPEFRLYISPSSDKETFLGIIYTPTQGGERLNPENVCLGEQEKEQLYSKEVVFLNNIKMYKEKETITPKEVKINTLNWSFSDTTEIGLVNLMGYYIGEIDYSETMDEIVSTFKFTSPKVLSSEEEIFIDKNGLKTFKNDIFGFEIKYPSDWTVCVDSCLQLPSSRNYEKSYKRGFYKGEDKMFTINEFNGNNITEDSTFLELVEKQGGNFLTEGSCGHDPIQKIETESKIEGYGGTWYCCGRGCGVKSIDGYYAYFENINITQKIARGEAVETPSPEGFSINFTPAFLSGNNSTDSIDQITSTFKFID